MRDNTLHSGGFIFFKIKAAVFVGNYLVNFYRHRAVKNMQGRRAKMGVI